MVGALARLLFGVGVSLTTMRKSEPAALGSGDTTVLMPTWMRYVVALTALKVIRLRVVPRLGVSSLQVTMFVVPVLALGAGVPLVWYTARTVSKSEPNVLTWIGLFCAAVILYQTVRVICWYGGGGQPRLSPGGGVSGSPLWAVVEASKLLALTAENSWGFSTVAFW